MKEILPLPTSDTADLSSTIDLIADRLLRDVPKDTGDEETRQRRQDWLEALHAVAAADGKVSAEELAEIERIVGELGLNS